MTDTTYSSFRWYIFFTMFIVTATTSMSMISPIPVMGLLVEAMPGLDQGQVGQATMTVFNFFLGLAALFGGILLDKLGPIKVFIGGLLLIIIGAFLMPVIGSSVKGMILIRILQGLGTGPVMAAAAAIAASYFPMGERSIVAGAQGAAVAFGIIMGLQIVPRLASSPDNVFNALMILAPVGIVGIILSLVALFGPKVEQEVPAADTGANGTVVSNLYKKALLDPLLWVAIVCFMLMSGIFQQYNNIVAPYIFSAPPLGLGYDVMVGNNALSWGITLFCIGSFVSGFVCEKMFNGSPRPVIAIGFIVACIISFVIKYDFVTSSQGQLTFSVLIIGFFCSWVNPQTQAYIAKNYAKEITGKLGGLSMFVGILIGSTTAVAWMNQALSATGNYMRPINIMAGLCLAGFIISLFLKQKNK